MQLKSPPFFLPLLSLIAGGLLISSPNAIAQTYLYPGVYVEEATGGARPIQSVDVSTAAFLGVAPNAKAKPGEPTSIRNYGEFTQIFGGKDLKATTLDLAVRGFFNNGGGSCWIVNLGEKNNLIDGLERLEPFDGISLVAAPGYTTKADHEAILTHCEKMVDRFAILDCREEATPESVMEHRPRNSDRGLGAFYFPWIVISDPQKPAETIACPPSGHIAGVYARVDNERGVFESPANEFIDGALDLTHQTTDQEQEILNPAGINAIRFFPTQGIKIWGARTLADPDSEWRYISVRRLTLMIEESIAEGTRWAVFEPNDRALWGSLKRDVSAFLNALWSDGALIGASPEDAFFVKCDQDNNPPSDIEKGVVTITIGIAPVKPAEFIVFNIRQSAAASILHIGEIE